MSLIVCLETSTTNCSVALVKNGSLLVVKEDNSAGYSHAEKLHVFIDEILNENELLITQLNAVAVSKGPGSYTGLRIGVSAAKGLCYALEIPLIAINTLTILAASVNLNDPGFIIPMLDARRMEVYTAVFDHTLCCVETTSALILTEDSYQERLQNSQVTFVGNGVAKFQDICTHPNARFLDSLPSAKSLASLAYQQYMQKDFEDVAYFEPYYLKDFVAGIKKT